MRMRQLTLNSKSGVWHCKWVLRHTLEAHGDFLWRNNLHGNCLLVCVQIQVLYPRPSMPRIGLVFVFTVVFAIAFPPLARQDSVEFAGCG